MATALIGIYNFERLDSTTWLTQFEIEIQGCNQATGDFSYRLTVRRSNNEIYYRDKKSEPYTPADGKSFIFDQREDIPSTDNIVGVDKIVSTYCRCGDPSRSTALPYLPAFDPYKVCHPTAEVRPQSIVAAIGLLYELAVVYSTISQGASSGDIGGFLKSASEALEKMSKTLAAIQDQLEEISSLLKDLPERIRGVWKVETTKQLLGRAGGLASLISDKLAVNDIGIVLPELIQTVDQLQVTLEEIVGVQGLAGYMVISPFVGIWLAGAASIQKVRLQQIPGYVVSSPWTGSLMTKVKGAILSLLEVLDNANFDYQTNWIPQFTEPSIFGLREATFPGPIVFVVHEVGGKYFLRKTVAIERPGMIRLVCSRENSGDDLQVASPKMIGGGPDFPFVEWSSVNPSNFGSPAEKRSYETYMLLNRDRDEVKAFFDWAYPMSQDRSGLLNPFTEPDNFWKVGTRPTSD